MNEEFKEKHEKIPMTKTEEDSEINGTKYKRITKVASGTTIWQMDVPLVLPRVHASGLHVVFVDQQQNHYDHFKSGLKWREYINL